MKPTYKVLALGKDDEYLHAQDVAKFSTAMALATCMVLRKAVYKVAIFHYDKKGSAKVLINVSRTSRRWKAVPSWKAIPKKEKQ